MTVINNATPCVDCGHSLYSHAPATGEMNVRACDVPSCDCSTFTVGRPAAVDDRRDREGFEMRWRPMFEPRDLWVGVFWDRRSDGLHVYVCPLPMLVLHVVFRLQGEQR